MAVKASHPWPAQQLVPAYGGNPGGADVLAATGRTCARGVDLHPAHTEGVDADECAIGERDQRSEWTDRTSHRARDSGGRARSEETEPSPDSGGARTDRQESG